MTSRNIQPVRYLAISSAYALVVASAGFGAVYAYRVGIEHSILLAGLSVLMALGLEGCKPLAFAYAMKAKTFVTGVMLASLGVVAVAYSLTSELSLLASNRSDLAATRTAQSEAAREAVGKRQRITEELRSLGIQRPSETIQAELNPLLSDKRLQNCQGWLANYRLREICIDKVSPLQAELAKAERREKLEADLGGTTRNDSVVQVGSSDPGSTALSMYLKALGLLVPIDIVAQWLVLVPVLALELGSAFAMVLVQTTQPEQSVVPEQQQIEPRASAVGTPTRSQARRDLLVLLHSRGGVLTANERDLAAIVGYSKPTLRRAILELEAEGAIIRAPSRWGTMVRAAMPNERLMSV